MNAREYDVMYAVEDRHWWYVALHDLVLRFVARERTGGRDLAILDAGCGTGRLCRLLERFGRVTGCDISELALSRCRERGVAVFPADLGRTDLGEARYDVITSIDVLYHRAVTDETAALASLHRALKPGGALVLNLVAHEFLRSTHDIAVHTRRRYTRADLLPLLAQAGFRVERASYRLSFLFAPIAAYRIARRLLHAGGAPDQVASDVSLPPAVVNGLLLGIARAENRVIEHRNLSLGTSLFVVARKPFPGESRP